jgi:hypothetical protein
MIEEAAWQLVPQQLPPDIEPWILHVAEQARFNDRQLRAYAWANWLLNRTRFPEPVVSTAVLGAFRGDYQIMDITAGFIPVTSNQDRTASKRERYLRFVANQARKVESAASPNVTWTFGVMIGVQATATAFFEPFVEQEEIGQFVAIDGFPVMCELRENPSTFLQQAPVNPLGPATSTCFVKPLIGKRFYGAIWSEGILIARHVLGPTPAAGALVNMQTGPALPVVDIDSATTIDAAVLDLGAGHMSTGAKRIPIYPAVAPGTNVTVYGISGHFRADVLRVMDDPKYFGNMVAHRAFLDQFGQYGDSGALVREANSQEAVGVYIGQTKGPPAEGVVQLMRQVTKYFEVDLYE